MLASPIELLTARPKWRGGAALQGVPPSSSSWEVLQMKRASRSCQREVTGCHRDASLQASSGGHLTA